MKVSNMLQPGGTTELSIPSSPELNCITADGLWYYNHFDELQKPPSIYKKLVSTATDKVWVWDPYLHEGDEVLFENVKREVEVRILSAAHYAMEVPNKTMKFMNALSQVQRLAQFKLTIRIYNTKNDEDKTAFHDRYLFVDNEVYIVGSSIQYHRRRITSTSIHKINHASAKEVIKNQFKHVWQHSNTHQTLSIAGGQL